jgi:hypothetical protein
MGSEVASDDVPGLRAIIDNRRVLSSCPAGHGAGASASADERRRSKVSPHARHRYS